MQCESSFSKVALYLSHPPGTGRTSHPRAALGAAVPEATAKEGPEVEAPAATATTAAEAEEDGSSDPEDAAGKSGPQGSANANAN